MKHRLTNFIDFFYPLFDKWIPPLTFRYAVCGSTSVLFSLFTYYIGYHFIFSKEVVYLGLMAFKPHIAALILSGILTFLLSFCLNKYVVFVDSNIKGRIQLFRFTLSFGFNLMLNFFMLKLLVESAHIDAFVSQLITTLVIIVISYLTQKYFTFKIK